MHATHSLKSTDVVKQIYLYPYLQCIHREKEKEKNIVKALNRRVCLLPVAKRIRHRILFALLMIRYHFGVISMYVSVLFDCTLVHLLSGTDGRFHVITKLRSSYTTTNEGCKPDYNYPNIIFFSVLQFFFSFAFSFSSHDMRTNFKPIHALKLKLMDENVVYTSSQKGRKKTPRFAEMLVAHAKLVSIFQIAWVGFFMRFFNLLYVLYVRKCAKKRETNKNVILKMETLLDILRCWRLFPLTKVCLIGSEWKQDTLLLRAKTV